MCMFRNCKVKSDQVLLKKDGVIAYKKVSQYGPNKFRSLRGVWWFNKRMTLEKGTKMNIKPNGRGPGIYAYKNEPSELTTQTYVKVLLYGRVIEYRSHRATGTQAGYMAQRAEILEVL
jgi:hypothetical protein